MAQGGIQSPIGNETINGSRFFKGRIELDQGVWPELSGVERFFDLFTYVFVMNVDEAPDVFFVAVENLRV
jgi:hypothetical protein